MQRVIRLAAVIVVMTLMAVPAFAQSGVNLQKDSGDNYTGGQVTGDDSPDCAQAQDVLESGLCAPGATLNTDPATQTNPGTSASASADSASVASSACPDPDFPRSTPDGCQASNLPDVGFLAAPSAPPSASASPSATPSSSASASSTQYVATPNAAPPALPDTSGAPILALGAGLLLVGSGLVARKVVR